MNQAFLTCAILQLIALPISAQQSAAKQELAHHGHTTQSVASAQEIWTDLMAGNQRFATGKAKPRDLIAMRKDLAKEQHPSVVVLTCSDSRVAPELLFDQNLGDLFVVRSAGNIADAIGVGSIEYAVEHLGSSVLVVLGHTECGAVTAACSGEEMPTANLQAIVDKIEPAVSMVRASSKSDELIEAAIKENVHQSAKGVLASSKVLQQLVQDGTLTVIEAEYQLDTGEVIRLDGVRHSSRTP